MIMAMDGILIKCTDVICIQGLLIGIGMSSYCNQKKYMIE